MSIFGREPAAVVGFIAAVVVLVAQQALTAGIVSSTGGINVLNLVISVTPLLAALIIRAFVTPATA